MNRIKFCLLVCTLFGLTACGQEEAVFSLTAAQQEQYSAQIEQITEEYYWDFDGDSLQFSEVKLPENSGAAENLYTASADCTYDMRNYAGSSVVLGTASLVHYNGDVAGQLLCYFSGSTLIGVCYQGGYDNGYYSLQERNPFLADGHFKQYEQWETPLSTDAFSSSAASFPKDGFVSVGKDAKGNVLTASIQDGAVQIYRYQGGALRLWRTLTFGSGLDATAATFYDGENGSELAVVLSSLTVQGQGEGEHTYTRSEKIVFYDNNMQRMNTEIALEASQGSALAAEGSRLLVGGEKLIQYYEKGAEGWENTGYFTGKSRCDYIGRLISADESPAYTDHKSRRAHADAYVYYGYSGYFLITLYVDAYPPEGNGCFSQHGRTEIYYFSAGASGGSSSVSDCHGWGLWIRIVGG